MRRRSGLLILLSVLLIQSIALPAIAGLTDIPVTGTVKDRAGTGLAAVKVNYGTRQAWTDSSGNFTINLPAGQSFTLYATKTGLESESQSGTAWPGTEVHFEMYYKLNHWQTPSVFNNSSPVTITVMAKSYAPPSTSCLSWTDQASGTNVSLQLSNGVPGGESTWTGTYVVPATHRDGTFGTWAVSRDCSSGTDLTYTSGSSYLIDSVAPVIDLNSLVPRAGDDTTFVKQPLILSASDAGSGLDPNGARFEFGALGGNGSIPLVGVYKTGPPRFVATPPDLAAGTQYAVTATVHDLAGNASAVEWDFYAITTTVSSIVLTTIDSAPTSSEEFDLFNDLYRFDQTPVQMSAFSLTRTSNAHSGRIRVLAPFPLGNLQVRYSLGFEEHASIREAGEKPIRAIHSVEPSSGVVVTIPPSTGELGQVTAIVPKGASNVALEAVSITTSPSLRTCADPIGAPDPRCWPDPVMPLTFSASDGSSEVRAFGHACPTKVIESQNSFNVDSSFSLSSTCDPINVVFQSNDGVVNNQAQTASIPYYLCPTSDKTYVYADPSYDYKEICTTRDPNSLDFWDSWIRNDAATYTYLHDIDDFFPLAETKNEGFWYERNNVGSTHLWWFDSRCCVGFHVTEQWRYATHWHSEGLTQDLYFDGGIYGDRKHRDYCKFDTFDSECQQYTARGTAYFHIDPWIFWCYPTGSQDPVVEHEWVVTKQYPYWIMRLYDPCPLLRYRNSGYLAKHPGSEFVP